MLFGKRIFYSDDVIDIYERKPPAYAPRHRADSVGLIAMRLQAYLTAVVVNMKRIVAVIPA